MQGVADILRHVDDDRAGAARCGDGKGPPHQFGDAPRALHPDEFLDRRAKDVDLTALLGHVLPGMLAVTVADDGDHRGPGVQCLHQPRHQIGSAWPERGIHQADAAGDLGEGIRREHPGALVIDEVMIHPQPPARIVEGQ